jgi:hypothetical protein
MLQSMSSPAPLTLLSAVVPLNSTVQGWTLADGDGVRSFHLPVAFEREFSAVPLVHLGLTGVDANKDHNLRVKVRAIDITPSGFTLVLETWLHSQIHAADVSWLAVGF